MLGAINKGRVISTGAALFAATSLSCYASRSSSARAASAVGSLGIGDIFGRISKHQSSHKPPKDSTIMQIDTGFFAANPEIEDRFAIASQLKTSTGALFGVYDGHSGTGAAEFCSQHLFSFIEHQHLQNYANNNNANNNLLTETSFVDADHTFLELSLRSASESRSSLDASGACVNVVHVDGQYVTSANAGDCRALIGRYVDGKWTSVDLSLDHQIDTNPAERERLLSEHAGEPDVIANARVKGRLQPTRGFGDGVYKRSEFAKAKRREGYFPPYTTARADIKTHQLQPGDEFLVLATDGVFGNLNNQQVVDCVADYLTLKSLSSSPSPSTPLVLSSLTLPSSAPPSLALPLARAIVSEQAMNNSWANSILNLASSKAPPINASSWLIANTLYHASEDVVGRRPSWVETMSAVLQCEKFFGVPARQVHDDITAIVVFFDKDQKVVAAPSSDKCKDADALALIPAPKAKLQKIQQK